MQNVCLPGVGERHHWLWDFHQLEQALEVAGFTAVQRRSANSGAIEDFPLHPLDIDAEGRPRMGAESLCVEALKPSFRHPSLRRHGEAAMTDLTEWIPADDLAPITTDEQRWLAEIFERFGGYPSLEEVWAVMDEPWRELRCDPAVMDARIGAFYSHPVWLLNGLFIEQHEQSLDNRRRFTDWVAAQSPRRVADYGGGFGGLARMIGAACPAAEVEVIEPHPHPLAIERARRSPNVRYRPELDGEYDILIATDVFEHVPDPLGLAAETAAALKPGGRYLIANCFQPVILCHLPQTFHFRHSWDRALQAMGLEPAEPVVYGRAFVRRGALDIETARAIERQSRRLWGLTRLLPGRIARPLTKAFI
jgi:SAM-dependent methyltransferase